MCLCQKTAFLRGLILVFIVITLFCKNVHTLKTICLVLENNILPTFCHLIFLNSSPIFLGNFFCRSMFYRLQRGNLIWPFEEKWISKFVILRYVIFIKDCILQIWVRLPFRSYCLKLSPFFLWTWGNEHLDAQQSFRLKCTFPFYIVLHSVGQKPFFKLCGHLIYPIMCRDLSINWSIGFIKEYPNLWNY